MALTQEEVLAEQARQAADAQARARRMADLQLAQQIEETFGVPFLLSKLEDYPDEIRQQKEAFRAAGQAVAEAKEEVEYQEALLKAEIASAVNPATGKPAYSNDDSRKAEFLRRKRVSEPYQAAVRKLREAEGVLAGVQFDLEKLVDKFSAARAQSRMTAGRLGLVAK